MYERGSREMGEDEEKHKAKPAAKEGDDVVTFMVKVFALETVRRVSKAKCPILWTTLQGLQLLCYPPFKWWTPLRFILKRMHLISRPLLLVSILNAAFGDRSPSAKQVVDQNNTQSLDCLAHLHHELQKQGILTLPQRISDDLHRYYITANGDIQSLITAVKKTMRWRETYRLLTAEELEESWSKFIFWHGSDVNQRPCLFVRLGLAFASLPPSQRVRFTQALVSQVEHGMVQLMDKRNAQVTVLVDCQGIAPLRFPMQTMRHCVNILKDHFPNVLGCMIIIRATPFVRVITCTFCKILRPSTRQKLRMEGDGYEKLITDLFQTLPAYLGGTCSCSICQYEGVANNCKEEEDEGDDAAAESSSSSYLIIDAHCIRAAVVAILILLVMVAFLEGIYNTDDFLTR